MLVLDNGEVIERYYNAMDPEIVIIYDNEKRYNYGYSCFTKNDNILDKMGISMEDLDGNKVKYLLGKYRKNKKGNVVFDTTTRHKHQDILLKIEWDKDQGVLGHPSIDIVYNTKFYKIKANKDNTKGYTYLILPLEKIRMEEEVRNGQKI